MFRRSSKLTAMLVAAAAVVSIVPASASERLGNKDGHISTGIAFDGGYVYDGYRTDDDDAALYYNNGSKDVNVDEDEDYDYDSMTKYGSKYALVYDSNEPYLVDLTTGKIEDDESLQDKYENSQTKLKTALKKTDRYGKSTTEAALTLVDAEVGATGNDAKYVSGKLNDVWYMYTVDKALVDDGSDDAAAAGKLFGFTNESGKYVDASNLANLYVYSPEEDKTVKISEYRDTEKNITAELENLQPIAQDKDYIYAVATVTVTDTNTKKAEATQYFLQKISKEQGDKKDGAYVPKSVTSYQIDGGTIYKDDDMEDANGLFPTTTSVAPVNSDGYNMVNYNVKNGNIIVTGVKADSVKVFTVKLKKAKVDSVEGSEDRDAYVVMQDDDADQDLTDLAEVKVNADKTLEDRANTSLKNSAISIDAEGNTWALDKGKIYKFDGSDFKEMFTCDRSLNSIDVYDENNLIAWDATSGGDVYTTVSEGKKQTEEDAGVEEDKKDETPVVKAGWDKNADGTWAFYKDGAKATGWLNDKGTWYYLDAAGTMKTGWVQAGSWYYLNASGAMQTGWVNDNGTWYYCNGSGAMQTGWLLDGSTWYYLNANGSMAANTTVDGYVLGANGAML